MTTPATPTTPIASAAPVATAAAARRRGRPGHDVESVLAGAVEVFTRQGFDGTSMEDIADHLGITKSSIYHHVASKDALLDLALARALDGLSEVLASTDRLTVAAPDGGATGADPATRLEFLLRHSVEVLVQRRPFVTVLLRLHGGSEVERRALRRRTDFDRYLAGLVSEAADAGQVRDDVDPALIARLLFGMVNSLTEWLRPHHRADEIADTIVALAFHGMSVPATPGGATLR